MTRTILGLDIGGANLKAATPDGRAVSVPFALWKQPDRLPAALAELVGRFPETTELAVTMTGELCDCYETKRQGVGAILDAAEFAASGRPVRVWGTDWPGKAYEGLPRDTHLNGTFLTPSDARRRWLEVASANWLALGVYAARLVIAGGCGVLMDIGSTTTDLLTLEYGMVRAGGATDPDRLLSYELQYTGVRRTPVCAILRDRVAAELFATMHDVYLILGELPNEPENRYTADGRPATRDHALGRLARMRCGDRDTLGEDWIVRLAEEARDQHLQNLHYGLSQQTVEVGPRDNLRTVVLSGVGEFLGRRMFAHGSHWLGTDPPAGVVSLSTNLGPAVSACAPAYAVAILAAERPS